MIHVNAAELIDGLNRVKHASPSDEARPILATVLFETRPPSTLRLVAADNYRIALVDLYVAENADKTPMPADVRLAMSNHDLPVLLAWLRRRKRVPVAVEFDTAAPAISFRSFGSIEVRCVDGTWPSYEKVVEDAERGAVEKVTAIQPRFIVDTAKAMGKTNGAILRQRDALSPLIITAHGDPTFKEIIMPIRTPDESK